MAPPRNVSLILAALSVIAGTVFATPSFGSAADDAWRQAGLKFGDFVGDAGADGAFAAFNQTCGSSLKQFEGCFDGLSRAFAEGEPAAILVPADLQADFAGLKSQKTQTFGVVVAMTTPHFRGDTYRALSLDDLAFQKARWQAVGKLFAAAQAKQAPFDFTALIRYVETTVIGADREKASLVTGQALNAAVQRWKDPHSFFMPKTTMASRQTGPTTYVGIGVTLIVTENGALVQQVQRGAAAVRAGVRADDTITEVDGRSIQGLTLDQVTGLIRGEPGARVALTVKRGGKTLTLDVLREAIVSKNVESRLLAPDASIGYVRVASFAPPQTSDDFLNAVDDLTTKKHVKALIVDLRDNGGGAMGNLFLMAEPFLNQWDEIYTVRDLRMGYGVESNARSFDTTNAMLVVLVNGYSASASEVFAGTMQDHKRAFVLGTQTRGKGTGQEPNEQSYHFPGVLYYETTKLFLLPSGRTTQVYGITPDAEVLDTPYASKDDTFVLRESDFDNAVAPIGPKPPAPADDAVTLKACVDARGTAKTRYDAATAAGAAADYPLEYARDFVDCAVANGLMRLPSPDSSGGGEGL